MYEQKIINAFSGFATLRKKNIELVNSIDIEKVTTIPSGLNNNIYWQAGHLVAVSASLLFKRTKSPIMIDENALSWRVRSGRDSAAQAPGLLYSQRIRHEGEATYAGWTIDRLALLFI